MIRFAYVHGLRVAELVMLRRDQVDLDTGCVHVRRVKGGFPATHPLTGQEIRMLRQVLRDDAESPDIFPTERRGPLTDSAFRKIVARAGVAAGLPLAVHPHMLRHACGFELANDGRDTRAIQLYLGHRNIQHTVRYTELAEWRFQGFWAD